MEASYPIYHVNSPTFSRPPTWTLIPGDVGRPSGTLSPGHDRSHRRRARRCVDEEDEGRAAEPDDPPYRPPWHEAYPWPAREPCVSALKLSKYGYELRSGIIEVHADKSMKG